MLTCETEREKEKFRNWLLDLINSDQELELFETKKPKPDYPDLPLAASEESLHNNDDTREAKVNLAS